MVDNAYPTAIFSLFTILGEALRVAPALTDASVREIRVGLRPVPEDEMPILGTVRAIDKLYLATGLGHAGLCVGPFVGKVVADTMLGKKVEMDIEPFNVGRFK